MLYIEWIDRDLAICRDETTGKLMISNTRTHYACGDLLPRYPLPVIPTQVIHGPDYIAIRHIWSYDSFSNRPLWSWYCHAGNYYGMCEDARRFDWPNF